jgi:hypothetical protein
MNMNVKKSVLAAAMLVSIGGNAQALSIDVTTMKAYDGNGDDILYSGGLNTSVTGSVNSDSTGAIDSGITPFLGTPWYATQVMANETIGSLQSWSGTSGLFNEPFSYDYTLAAGQMAVGLYMDWSANQDIAILAIFDCGAGTVGTACSSVYTAGPAPQGTVMQNGPFAGDNITFSFEGTVSASAVPVPAAVWLFGSGLLGLIGVAKRKKA